MSDALRTQLTQLFTVGVAAADPYEAVRTALAEDPFEPALIVSVGKAAMRMAEAALDTLGRGARCLVITNYENARDLDGAEVFASGHPIPDENGAKASQAVLDALDAGAGPVLALISGGGSALLPAPAKGISLEEKAEVNRLLLASGADIRQMNLVRQQLSRLKGGGFIVSAEPHPVRALILSDVVGDDLSTIASGPTAPSLGTAGDAIQMLKRFGLWDYISDSVRDHLAAVGRIRRLKSGDNRLIGSNTQSLRAIAAEIEGVTLLADPVEGDVAEAARLICDQAAKSGFTLWGGETTVQIKGKGKGGRNQELALRIAVEAGKRGWGEWMCLQAGTDGRDGPTDAAGAIVDQGTLGRIAAKGGDIGMYLANNDSYTALSLSGDLLVTGATGTNVSDIGILFRK